MENVTTFERVDSFTQESETWVLIDRGNGEFTSMPKSVYDEQQKQNEGMNK